MPTSDDLRKTIARLRDHIKRNAMYGSPDTLVEDDELTALLDAAEAGLRARDAALEEAAKVAEQLVFEEVVLSGTNDATEGLKLAATRIRARKRKL